MKANWQPRACIGCLAGFLLFTSAVVIVSIAFTDDLKEQFARLSILPAARTPRDPREPFSEEPIPDLSYIEVTAAGYTNDADPEDEGIALDIQFYNSRGQPITFSGIPFKLWTVFYAFTSPLQVPDSSQGVVVYSGATVFDHSMRFGEMFGNYVRIPFRILAIDPAVHQPFGGVRVIIETSLQGSFEAYFQPVQFYEPE
jgi:hypothetical protein